MTMRRIAAVAAILGLAAQGAGAQAAAGPRLNTVLSTNPLGFLQFGPNVEFEKAASDAGAWAVGARLPSLGVMAHVINDELDGGWTVYGTWHFYPNSTRLRGWYLGPHLEAGSTTSTDWTSKILGGGGEFGYRWVKPNGFSMVLGGMLGMFKSDDTYKDGSGSAGNESYAVWMLNFSIGVAR